MKTVKELSKQSFDSLKSEFGYTNTFQAPKLVKVTINTGTGKIADSKKIDLIQDRLEKITGQKTSARQAKKSIASFKIRQGDIVAYALTLRGERMYSFLDKLVNIALPRTKDFRGIARTTLDSMGNMTLAIKEHTIFPEASDEELTSVFGFSITITTTAKSKKEAERFLELIGIPFKKNE